MRIPRSAVLAGLVGFGAAQTFRRLGTCPSLGCILPPDQSEFLPGQQFDIRFEVHAPVNGSEAAHGGVPDANFTAAIAKDGVEPRPLGEFFAVGTEPELERWSFGWYEDLFARDAGTPSIVNVASRAYRRLALYEPGEYVVTLGHYGNETTVARWLVRPLAERKRVKNVVFFIGDGMTTNMITASRLLAHKSVNGKYQSLLQLDKFPILGHQMTHSIDSFITDSANSASALYSGHKTTVNAMGVHVDSSPDPFDDPKVETIVELLRRIHGSAWGAVSTAFLADATPTALTAHSRSRREYGALVDQALRGLTNYSWPNHGGPDVYFGAGAEQFLPGEGSYRGRDYYAEFAAAGYDVSLNRTALLAASNSSRALGVFCRFNLPLWLDRNVFTDVLSTYDNAPDGLPGPALDLPGLRDMTLKAIDVLHERGGERGFFLMAEAASIDKAMHVLDYDRALGDLMELDDTVRAAISRLDALGVLADTLVIVSADHGHGFDVFGSADTEYLARAATDRRRRGAVGTYEQSGLSQYQVPVGGVSYGTGPNFPANWDPRYAIAAGMGAAPDHRENYRVKRTGPRIPAGVLGRDDGKEDNYVTQADNPDGFVVNGTLPVTAAEGVHSLTDVPVFATGPCAADFGGVYGNVDLFFKMAECLGLGRGRNVTDGLEGMNE